MNYKESITALLEGLKGIFENKTATEASAIAQAATKPSTIFYTSDTHAIVVGGKVYGRSNQVSADAPFAYLPSTLSSPSADPQFDGNHDTIYIQPIKTGSDAGKIKLWWYVNGAWTSTDTLDLVLPTDASDITYDLTDTPDLGSGDVQSAIEALDSKVEEVKEDVVRTGYLIASWEDDKILTSTTYAVGSTIGEWGNGVRYGSRGVRLNVKEGDKVLLDTYSPALFGLIFTDENRVVKALYNDRRFDGVWTAPVNGYCYIQDVLYRENYHYSSAHGHLAYMAHDARKRVAKGGDWYNEFMPRRMRDLGMLPKVIEASDTNKGPWYVESGNTTTMTMKAGTFQLECWQISVDGSADYPNAWIVPNYGTSKTNLFSESIYCSVLPKSGWVMRIYRCNANAGTTTNLALGYNGTAPDPRPSFNITVNKVFVHSSSNFCELYQLAQKIINGEVEVDNFYGVREKEVDFVKNAIGLQSISDLGYNILEHGATLPIDEEGYKYAKELYERYKDNPPTGNNWNGTASPFNHDTKLVYLPQIDFSKFKTSGADYLGSAFNGCTNLVCAGDITLPEESTGGYANFFNSTFLGCYSLKQVGNIQAPMNKDSGCYRMFYNCYALEKVGKIIVKGHQNSGLFGNCYSLERIEEIVLRDLPYDTNGNTSLLYNCVKLRYMLGKELGTRPASGTYMFNYATEYGVPNDKHPDARQSLVDSLLTYSYDRVNDPDNLGTAGTTCTITLSANSYAQLTELEIEQITAKGYTLTHP